MKSTHRKKPLRRWGELAFMLGTLFIAIGLALMAKGGLGMSMVTSQSYILSLGIPGLSFGTADYLFQGVLLIGYCLMVRRFSPRLLLSFLSAFIFGLTLDGIIWLFRNIPSDTLSARCLLFGAGLLFNALGVAFFFKTYLPLQVYELFVVGMCERFRLSLARAKTIFDCACCASAVILSLCFFRELRAVGIGTVICSLLNGSLIGWYGRVMDKFIDFSPAFPGLYRLLRQEEAKA